MGMLSDYFRARDDEDALRIAAHEGGPMAPGSSADGVEARGVDPAVVLGQLLAMVRGVAWTPEVCEPRFVHLATVVPIDSDPELLEGASLLEALADEVRDDLARVEDASIASLAARWVRIEELGGATADEIRPILAALVALARRARTADEHLYHWAAV